MKAIILAAGQGTRLKKYTQNLPKGMLVFEGKTIIERQIEMYRNCGIENIIVIKGFAGDKIDYKDVIYYTNENYAETNMVESFLTAKSEFDDDIILSYSDILFTESMLKEMIQNRDEFAVAVDTNWMSYWEKRYGRINIDTESLEINEDGHITSIGLENPSMEKIDARYIGLLKFSTQGLKKITGIWERDYIFYKDKPWKQSGKTIRKAYMTDLLQALIEDGCQINAVCFENGWVEFDTNEDYENTCRWVKDGSIKQIMKGIL